MLQKFFSQDEIKRITQNIINLPTLPTVVAKMIELVDNPKTTASSLGELISSDQVLTAKMLRLANSAFYAFPRKIATVNLAIVVLGFDMIKNLVLSVSVIDRFSQKSDGFFDVMKFWEHSVGCGVAGRMVARESGYRVIGETFTAGLLHDIGKLILREYLKVEFQEIVEIVEERDISFIEAEREVLGVTHTEIGGWLGEKWNLPGQLVEAIRTHHHPEEAQKAPELAALVHFSDVLCRFSEVGYGGDDAIPPLDEGVSHLLRLHTLDSGEVDMEYYKGDLLSEMKKAETFTNLIQESND